MMRHSYGYAFLLTGIGNTGHLTMKKHEMKSREDGGLRIRFCIEVSRISSVLSPICFQTRDTLMYLNYNRSRNCIEVSGYHFFEGTDLLQC